MTDRNINMNAAVSQCAQWHWHADSGQCVEQDVTGNLMLPCKISCQHRSEPRTQQTRSSSCWFPYCKSVIGNSESVRYDCPCASHGGKTPLTHDLTLDGNEWPVAVPGRFNHRRRTRARNWVKGWREGAAHVGAEKFVASAGKQTPEPDSLISSQRMHNSISFINLKLV